MSADRWNLAGARCLVTGGSKGLGLATVREMLKLGAAVLFTARGEEELKKQHEILLREDSDFEGRVFTVAADVSTREGRELVVATASELWDSSLDCLVNNVGCNRRKPVSEVTEEDWSVQLETNQTSAFFLCQLCLPLLRASNRGPCVVNVSSVAGIRSSGTGVVYAMTKAALTHMSVALACEWAPFGIRVNTVAPWMARTPLLEEAVKADPAQLDRVADATPLGRLGAVEDTAGAVCFLCMPASKYITGQTLAVDGGIAAQGFRGPCVDVAAAEEASGGSSSGRGTKRKA